MQITQIELRNFRIYQEEKLVFSPGLNIISGENAQGKTNLVEAIYVLATGKSFRTNYDRELINWTAADSEGLLIQARVSSQSGQFRLVVEYEQGQGKKIRLNETPLAKRSELLGFLTVVIFTPEDLNIVKGGPSNRRRFIDVELAQINPSFRGVLIDFNRVLLQRNNLLRQLQKDRQNISLKAVFDQQLTVLAARLVCKRVRALHQIAAYAGRLHQFISNSKEQLMVEYECSFPLFESKRTRVLDRQWELEEAEVAEILYKYLLDKQDEEIARGSTLYGPHRDDLNLLVNGRDVRAFGSQGQQRTAALALKLAELEYMKEETGEYPVLLLDDVLSELDPQRRKYLMDVVRQQVQIIVTTTDLGFFDPEQLEEALLFQVKKGKVNQLTNLG